MQAAHLPQVQEGAGRPYHCGLPAPRSLPELCALPGSLRPVPRVPAVPHKGVSHVQDFQVEACSMHASFAAPPRPPSPECRLPACPALERRLLTCPKPEHRHTKVKALFRIFRWQLCQMHPRPPAPLTLPLCKLAAHWPVQTGASCPR